MNKTCTLGSCRVYKDMSMWKDSNSISKVLIEKGALGPNIKHCSIWKVKVEL